jgi:hypothetical protein
MCTAMLPEAAVRLVELSMYPCAFAEWLLEQAAGADRLRRPLSAKALDAEVLTRISH